MKKLVTLIIMTSLLFTGLGWAQDGEPPSGRDGIQKPGQARVPRAIRENSDVLVLITAFKMDKEIFQGAFQTLRQRIADATEEDRAGLRNELRTLLKDNFHAQRDFRREIRRIARAAREAGE